MAVRKAGFKLISGSLGRRRFHNAGLRDRNHPAPDDGL